MEPKAQVLIKSHQMEGCWCKPTTDCKTTDYLICRFEMIQKSSLKMLLDTEDWLNFLDWPLHFTVVNVNYCTHAVS